LVNAKIGKKIGCVFAHSSPQAILASRFPTGSVDAQRTGRECGGQITS
jgi:hypothetical protein